MPASQPNPITTHNAEIRIATVETTDDTTELRALLRNLRTAGWRHTIDHRTDGRDADGAPWRDDVRVHVWTRHGETIEFEQRGYYVSYDPTGGTEEFVNIAVGIGWINYEGVGALDTLARNAGIFNVRLVPGAVRHGPGGPATVCPGCGDPYGMNGCYADDGRCYCANTCGEMSHQPITAHNGPPPPGLDWPSMWNELTGYVTAAVEEPTANDAEKILEVMRDLRARQRKPIGDWMRRVAEERT